MKIFSRQFSAFVFLSLLIISSQNVVAQYHLISKTPLGGEGGWDYITCDDAARKLYISHSTHVIVYDIEDGKIAGDIANTEGVHGIAIVSEFNHGFTSNGKSSTVTMFDLKTLDTLMRIKVGDKPDAIVYEPYSKCIICCNGSSENASIIDAATGKVKATIPLGGGPEFAVSDEKGHAFINIEDKNEVVEVDMKKFKVLHHWKVSPGEAPSGIAMDRVTHRLFIVCANKLMVVVNSKNGKVVSKLPIGKGVDAVIFDADKKIAISSNGEGTMTVVHEISANKFEVSETVHTQVGARTEAFDPKTHDVYLLSADFGPVPEATKDHPHPRPAILPNTFSLLRFGK